jgi:predicted HicB family RNase H-like nuclease
MPIDDKKQLVTSLRINPEIWKEAKVAAIQNDMTLTQLVEEAINCWIREQEKNKTKTK